MYEHRDKQLNLNWAHEAAEKSQDLNNLRYLNKSCCRWVEAASDIWAIFVSIAESK